VNALITSEVEWAAEILMRDADGGMIVTESAPSIVHLDFIVTRQSEPGWGLARHARALPTAGRLSNEGQAKDFASGKAIVRIAHSRYAFHRRHRAWIFLLPTRPRW